MNSKIPCMVVSSGILDYLEAWHIQKSVHSLVADGVLDNVLLILEHPHVYTLGRRGEDSDILATSDELVEIGAGVHHVDRGGQVTCHGPGQLVGYPIVNLRKLGVGPLSFVRYLEEVIKSTMGVFGIPVEIGELPTGVWVNGAKIAAIGIKVSRAVTSHGFAINVNPDLSYFDRIIPCGMPDVEVTSMRSEKADSEFNCQDVIPVLVDHFANVFNFANELVTMERLQRFINTQKVM